MHVAVVSTAGPGMTHQVVRVPFGIICRGQVGRGARVMAHGTSGAHNRAGGLDAPVNRRAFPFAPERERDRTVRRRARRRTRPYERRSFWSCLAQPAFQPMTPGALLPSGYSNPGWMN